MGQSEQSEIDDNRRPVRANVHDEFTFRIHLAMGSIIHPCSTIQGSVRYLSLMTIQGSARYLSVMRPGPFTSLDQANNPCSTVQALRGSICLWSTVLLLPDWTNNHYPRPSFKVVISPYNLALPSTASIDKAFFVIVMQFSIGKMIKEDRIRLSCTELVEPVTIFITSGCNCATLISVFIIKMPDVAYSVDNW